MKFESRHPEVLAKVTAACVKSLNEAGALISTRAKLLCPVDTGNLRKSVSEKSHPLHVENVDAEKLVLEVGTGVDYASHVEFGTRRSKAQPYLRPSGDNSRADVENIFRRNLRAVR